MKLTTKAAFTRAATCAMFAHFQTYTNQVSTPTRADKCTQCASTVQTACPNCQPELHTRWLTRHTQHYYTVIVVLTGGDNAVGLSTDSHTNAVAV
jgi:hypothetical protein